MTEGLVTSAQFFTRDGELAVEIAAAKSEAIAEVEAYADAGDSATLSSAQAFATGADAAVLSSANSYSDAQAAAAQAAAQAFASSADSTVLSTAQAYANAAVLAATPTGMILDYAGTTAPVGFLLCYGQNVSRSTYATLFAAIGTTFGAGDGSTTFGIPDYRGRVGAGKDDMGGSAASRLTNSGTGNPGIAGTTLGATGGTDRHTTTIAQMPAHTHTIPSMMAAALIPGGSNIPTSGGGSTITNNSTGGGEAHPNAQPTIVMNKIIKT